VWQASEGSEAREDMRKTFVRSHYAAWAKLMLSPLVRGWIAAFTHEERVTLVDSIFLTAPAREAMEALADGLEEAADPPSDDSPHHRASFCAALLNRMVRSRRLEALFAELPNSWERSSRGAEEAEAEALVSLIMAIPPRLANLLRAAPPSELGAEQWYCAVFEQLFCVLPPRLLSPAEEAGVHEDPSLLELLAARLLARIARVGHFGAIFPQLIQCSARLLALTPRGALEPLLEASLRLTAATGDGAERLRSLLRPLLRRSATARMLLSERFLLARVLPEAVLSLLLDLHLEMDVADHAAVGGEALTVGEGSKALLAAMRNVAHVWSTGSHVTHASMAQQRYLTAALLGGIERLPGEKAEELRLMRMDQLMNRTMDRDASVKESEVPVRKDRSACLDEDAPSEQVRRLGMKAAQRIALLIDPSKPLNFDASDSETEPIEATSQSSPSGLADASKKHDSSSQSAKEKQRPDRVKQRTSRRLVRRRGAGERNALNQVDDSDAGDSDLEEVDPDAQAWIPGNGPARPGGGQHGGKAGVSLLSLELEGTSLDSTGGNERDEASSHTSESTIEDAESQASEESMPAYDLTDDRSDLQGVKAPRHLRQLLSGLRAKEGEHELLSASLHAAEGLVRNSAETPELFHLAPALGRALLHLSNQYNLPRFGALRRNAL
ncbi:MAG: hypothetical protein SGPRY_010447, partial [Prymnesium sp.]